MKSLFRLKRILLIVVLVALFSLFQFLLLEAGRIRRTMASASVFGISLEIRCLLG